MKVFYTGSLLVGLICSALSLMVEIGNPENINNPTNTKLLLSRITREIKPPNNEMKEENEDDELPESTTTSSANFFANIQPIPGTDLYTGLYYRIGMKRFPHGVLTWTNAKTQHDGNYVQIDLNPNNLPYYAPGEKWDRDAQWMLTPTEKAGWYNLKNRAVQDGIATWSYEEVGGGNHIILSRKPEDVLAMTSPNGKWRNDSFWKPIQTAESQLDGFYKLELASFPQGSITWTEKKYGDYSHYIQVDKTLKNQIHYTTENKWYNDTLFKFSLAELQLQGVISEFEYTDLNFLVSIKNTTTAKYTVPNPSPLFITSTFENTFRKSNNLKLNFDQGLLGLVQHLKILANMPKGLGDMVYVLKRSASDQSSGLVHSDSTEQEYNIKEQVAVPPHTSLEVSAIYQWAELEHVPFKAILEVDGTIGQFTATPKQVQQALTDYGLKFKWSRATGNKFLVAIAGNLSASIGLSASVVSKEIPSSLLVNSLFKVPANENCNCDSNDTLLQNLNH